MEAAPSSVAIARRSRSVSSGGKAGVAASASGSPRALRVAHDPRELRALLTGLDHEVRCRSERGHAGEVQCRRVGVGRRLLVGVHHLAGPDGSVAALGVPPGDRVVVVGHILVVGLRHELTGGSSRVDHVRCRDPPHHVGVVGLVVAGRHDPTPVERRLQRAVGGVALALLEAAAPRRVVDPVRHRTPQRRLRCERRQAGLLEPGRPVRPRQHPTRSLELLRAGSWCGGQTAHDLEVVLVHPGADVGDPPGVGIGREPEGGPVLAVELVGRDQVAGPCARGGFVADAVGVLDARRRRDRQRHRRRGALGGQLGRQAAGLRVPGAGGRGGTQRGERQAERDQAGASMHPHQHAG